MRSAFNWNWRDLTFTHAQYARTIHTHCTHAQYTHTIRTHNTCQIRHWFVCDIAKISNIDTKLSFHRGQVWKNLEIRPGNSDKEFSVFSPSSLLINLCLWWVVSYRYVKTRRQNWYRLNPKVTMETCNRILKKWQWTINLAEFCFVELEQKPRELFCVCQKKEWVF